MVKKKIEKKVVRVKVAKPIIDDRSAFNCPNCKGLGLLTNGLLCPHCQGTGKI